MNITAKDSVTERRASSVQKERIPEGSYDMIAELAYLKAERRNFEPGHEMDDWLAAEKEYFMNKK